MSPASRTAPEIIEEALHHLRYVISYLDEPDTQVTADAIAMRLGAGIEAISALQTEMRDRVSVGEWADMWGMRNRLAHGYALADTTFLRRTARDDVPALIERLEAEMDA